MHCGMLAPTHTNHKQVDGHTDADLLSVLIAWAVLKNSTGCWGSGKVSWRGGGGRRASVEAGDRNRKWEPSRKNGDSVCAPKTRGHRKGPSSNRILKLTSPRETPGNMKDITDLY